MKSRPVAYSASWKKLRNISTSVWQPVAARSSASVPSSRSRPWCNRPNRSHKPLGFVQPMRAHDHRLALVAQPAHVVDHHLAAEHVEAARRFVEQHHGRRVDQCPGQRHALPLTGAQQRAAAVEQWRQIEQARASARRLSRASSRRQAVQIGKEQQHLADGEPRVHAVVGRHQADARLHFVRRLRSCESRPLRRSRRPAASRPTIMRIVVVFPAPFGPNSPYTSPAVTTNDNRSTATIWRAADCGTASSARGS